MTITNDHNKMYSSFSAFIDEWGKQFSDVRNILSYLNTYPDLMSSIELKSLHDSESILPEQEDWVRISAKFDNPLEKEFFKPYWVPIVRDSIDYFIDLSDENYPIFETHFIFFEPYNWHKQFLVKDISSLLLASDENINLQRILEKNEGKRWEQVEDFFEQRRKMAFEGKLHIEPVKPDELVLEESDDIQISHTGNTLIVEGASPLIIGLLPFDLEIVLKEIVFKYGEPFDNLADVKIIRDLIFLIRNSGMLRIDSIEILLRDYQNDSVKYFNNKALFSLSDNQLKDRMIEKK